MSRNANNVTIQCLTSGVEKVVDIDHGNIAADSIIGVHGDLRKQKSLNFSCNGTMGKSLENFGAQLKN